IDLSYDSAIPLLVNESSRKLWNQQYFTLTFPKPPQPGRKKRSRPSELQITVPRHDKRNLEEVQKPAHIWIRHSLRKNFPRPSIYLTVRRQTSFRHPYSPITHPKKAQTKRSKDDNKGTTLKKVSKKNTGSHETTPEYKKTVNDDKPKRGNETDNTPSKSSHESKLSEKSKCKSETIPESKYSNSISIKHQKKDKRDSKNSKETDIESICTKKYSKSSKHNLDVESETSSKSSSNMDSVMCFEESGAEPMEFDMWLKNYSQNNSKKPPKKDAKKDAKKGSDAESVDSKDAKKESKKGKKDGKKDDKKKGAKKDAGSTDAESGDSKDAKKDSKKGKKDGKKDDKKKDAKKDAGSTDAESVDSKDAKKGKKESKKDEKKKDAKKDAESTDAESVDSKDAKKDSKKGKKDSKKVGKKKDVKKDTSSTDADSESERDFKKGKKDSKEKKGSKKDVKKKSAMKSEESTETESDWESKKDRKDAKKIMQDSKKGARKDAIKDVESTDAESDVSSKKDLKKPQIVRSSDAESEESLYKLGPKKREADESDATSTDSKKEAQNLKREFKMPSRRTTFKQKEKKIGAGRVPPSRERPPLPPCEPLLPSPRVKRLCQCQMPPPPPKPRYAPLALYLYPVLEAQLAVSRGPPLAPSSVLLPVPVGKQIEPPPNTGSGAALLCCGRVGHCPSRCHSQMMQTGQVGGRVVSSPSTMVRGCVPAGKAGGHPPSPETVAPLLCAALLSASGWRSAGAPEGGERSKGIEKVFEGIMTENFPNLKKESDIQVQEAQRVPNRKNPSRPTPRHIIIKMARDKDKETILKATREKQRIFGVSTFWRGRCSVGVLQVLWLAEWVCGLPVGKQIAPPPNTWSGAALLHCGRAGHSPSWCLSQMLLMGYVGGRITTPASTEVRYCIPARKAGGHPLSPGASAPPLCAAAHSSSSQHSVGGLGEDHRTAPPLLCVKTYLLVCLGDASSLRDQGGRILSASGCKQVSLWPLKLLSP
ncbi:cylicin-1, partial [Camelus dromedarius]|uniref:cylicin-1 n=1 Tax=Camelus dromedarius TaxID=9838 RepID=UPI00311A50CB